jgi:hypothetical protein
MPRGDGTGPAGFGSMTGRAAGYYTGYSMPGFANSWVPGWGGRGKSWWGRGRRFWGRGRGLRWGHVPYGYHSYYGYPPY